MIKYFSYSAGQWLGTTFNPALGKQTKAVMRPAWSSQQDPRQPGLYRETCLNIPKELLIQLLKEKDISCQSSQALDLQSEWRKHC